MIKIHPILSKRWVRLSLIIAVVAVGVNFCLTTQIKSGLRDLATRGKVEAAPESKTFFNVGPTTVATIREVTAEEYSITVLPFDWFGESLLVTHTAFISSSKWKIGIRIRFNPFDGYFHIVGFYTIR